MVVVNHPASLAHTAPLSPYRHLVAWIWQESSRIKHLWRLTDSEVSSLFSGLAYPCNKVPFRGSIPHPAGLLCTLRRGRRLPRRNTRYRAGATPYPDRTFTGWNAPAFLAHQGPALRGLADPKGYLVVSALSAQLP